MSRVRADRRLVELGLAAGVDEAARLILAGEVWKGTERVRTAGETLPSHVKLEHRPPRRYVSRGGAKLAGALDALPVEVEGRICVDVGCSTGGFTDCLLQRGAKHVWAIDVGYGQFDWRLRNDARVTLLERTNVRTMDPGVLNPRPELIVADLSFIALRSVLSVFCDLIDRRGDLVLLVKPQFELAPEDVRGGVVTDPLLHERAVISVVDEAARLGLSVVGRADSPLRGPKGNREFFVALRAGAQRNRVG